MDDSKPLAENRTALLNEQGKVIGYTTPVADGKGGFYSEIVVQGGEKLSLDDRLYYHPEQETLVKVVKKTTPERKRIPIINRRTIQLTPTKTYQPCVYCKKPTKSRIPGGAFVCGKCQSGGTVTS